MYSCLFACLLACLFACLLACLRACLFSCGLDMFLFCFWVFFKVVTDAYRWTLPVDFGLKLVCKMQKNWSWFVQTSSWAMAVLSSASHTNSLRDNLDKCILAANGYLRIRVGSTTYKRQSVEASKHQYAPHSVPRRRISIAAKVGAVAGCVTPEKMDMFQGRSTVRWDSVMYM